MSVPASRIVPDVGSQSRRMQFATVDFPLPDSPTSPSISPRASVSETPSTACTTVRPRENMPPAGKCLTRSTTSRTGSALTPPRSRRDGSRRRDAPAGRRAAAAPRERQRASARGQRSANAQATGSSRSDGTRPGISCSRSRVPSPSYGRGIAPSRPIVYGCCGCAKSSSTVASSAFRPAYMTSTRSATSATTPRLCVMSTIAVPSLSRMSRIRSRMPAWIVTSSAVVGSSATRIFGSQASAIAIITRCRMPPESWCGYSFSRRSGAGMRTSSRSSIARARAAPRDRSRCRCSTSPIW